MLNTAKFCHQLKVCLDPLGLQLHRFSSVDPEEEFLYQLIWRNKTFSLTFLPANESGSSQDGDSKGWSFVITSPHLTIPEQQEIAFCWY